MICHPLTTIKHFTEMCSGSEEGSYSRLIDFSFTQFCRSPPCGLACFMGMISLSKPNSWSRCPKLIDSGLCCGVRRSAPLGAPRHTVGLGTTGCRGWTTALCSSGEGHKTRRCRKAFRLFDSKGHLPRVVYHQVYNVY